MFEKRNFSIHVRLALVMALIIGAYVVVPAAASAGRNKIGSRFGNIKGIEKSYTRESIDISPAQLPITEYNWHTFYGPVAVNDSVTDLFGNTYIVGYSSQSWNGPGSSAPINNFAGQTDIVVIKLDEKGIYQWHTFYGANNYDYGKAIAVDTSGNVYIVGESAIAWNGPAAIPPLNGFANSQDLVLIKLNSSGVYQWHTFYGSATTDSSAAVDLDLNGNIYLSGLSGYWIGPDGELPLHDINGMSDIVILKLNISGEYQWHTFFGSASGDTANSIEVDSAGDIYLAGTSSETWNGPGSTSPLNPFFSSFGFQHILILKLNNSGDYQWHTFYGASEVDVASEIKAFLDGNIYIAGSSNGTWNGPNSALPLNSYAGGTKDFVVMKLTSTGAYLWHTFYGSSGADGGNGMDISITGDIYVAGSSTASWNGSGSTPPLNPFTNSVFGLHDITILALNNSGSYLWHTFYGSPNGEGGGSVSATSCSLTLTGGSGGDSWNGPGGIPPLNPPFADFGPGSVNTVALKMSSSATVYNVTNVNDSGPGSLRQAITDACPGDTITFDASLSGQAITLGSTLVLDKDVTIDGSSLSSKIEISGNNSAQVLTISPGINVTLNSIVIRDGFTSETGGGVQNSGSLTVQNSDFVNNSAAQYGGAISNSGNLTITDSMFTGNAATIDGGAVASNTRIILSKSVFSSNTAGNFGGAIAAQTEGQIENSTFYNNSATVAGGLYVQNDDLLTFRLANNTISQSTGGGIYNGGDSLELFNNIIANSITGADCYTITMFGVTGNNNLVESNAPSPNACGSVSISADPLLGSLQDNGGFTQTMALLPGSPAIDAGDNANCPATDQRGVTRPQGSGCDIGAYEYEASIVPTPTFTPTDTATSIPTFTPSSTFTPAPSFTPTPTATKTQTVSPTWTPPPTATTSSGFPSSNVLDTFNRANGGVGANWSGSTSGYSVASNRLDVGNGAPMLWNATSFGTDQEAFVTLTNIDPSGFYQDLILKSQSAASWESGAIDVSYDAARKRVIVWTFSNAQGWVQRGADIPVTFVNGDQFGVRARSNGTVEVYRNGVLIAARDVSGWTYSANGGYIGVWYQSAANAVLDDFGGGSLSSVQTATLTIPTISTPTPAPSSTATNIPTSTQTLVPSFTPSITSTPTRTPTLSVTSTSTPTPSMFIQVLQPNGGEVLNVGSIYRITWNSSPNIDKVSIGYKSCDSCLDWIAFSTPNVGYYDWNVSVGNTINTQFKISITGYDTGVGSVTDLSDANFTVLQPTPTPTFTRTPTATSLPSLTPTATTSSGFPSSGVLDTFNRANGGVGASWSGSTSGYSIASNRLDVGNGAPMLWNATSFGANQEAFVTLTNIDPSGFYQDLILKSQSATSWESGAIDVSYDAAGKRVIVWTFSNAQGWVRRGADIPVTFANGDQFGVRAQSNGAVEIYRNGVLIATRDVSGWTYSANGGYIGVWYQSAANAVLDDFGGGSLSSAQTATPTFTPSVMPPTSTFTPTKTVTPTRTPTSTATKTSTPTPTTTEVTVTASFTPIVLVTPPPFMFVQVLRPNGGEVLNVGSTYRIIWNSSSNIDKVFIGYKSCDSCLDWIVTDLPNVGYYDWNVSVGNTTNTQFKISITGYDTGVGSASDVSDADFTVLQPTPTPTFTRTPTATSLPSLTPTATTSSGFPSSNVLDTFNRANGGVGANWSGSTSGYSIAANRLDVGNGAPMLWNATSFGTDQEAFVTLTNIDASGFYQDLILKSQSATSWESGAIDVSYDAARKRVIVWTFSNAQGWVQRGADIPVTFVNGDQFGVRARSNGTVEIYRNGVLIATRDVSGWTYSANGGYIGVWYQDSANAVIDDFGGGSLSSVPTATPTVSFSD